MAAKLGLQPLIALQRAAGGCPSDIAQIGMVLAMLGAVLEATEEAVGSAYISIQEDLQGIHARIVAANKELDALVSRRLAAADAREETAPAAVDTVAARLLEQALGPLLDDKTA